MSSNKNESEQTLPIKKINLWKVLHLTWLISTISAAIYLFVIYIGPLILPVLQPVVPMKLFVEILICTIPITSGLLWTCKRFFTEKVSTFIDSEHLVIKYGKHIITTCCLNLTSVPGSVMLDQDGNVRYNTALLLAIRAGMDKNVSIAYEASLLQGQPSLHLFITAMGESQSILEEILRREATRLEAILLATLGSVELRQLRNKELRKMVHSFAAGVHENNSHKRFYQILTLDGNPEINPTTESSQVGTFISTAIRQGYLVSFTCVFSKSSPGREKQSLERKWKVIRDKEKRKDDSLADQADKIQLLDKYEEIQNNAGWFNVSTFFIISGSNLDELKRTREAVSALALSVWGGKDNIIISDKPINQRVAYKLLTRRHITDRKLHANRLAAFVNTPIQKLPVITSTEFPDFHIPPMELVSNELIIGKAVYRGRSINDVGLKPEWLREHIAILGATGTGKTTLVKHLMAQVSSKTTVPWWIFDVKGSEYLDLVEGLSDVLVIRPGLDSNFVMDLLDSEIETSEYHIHTTFAILRELLKERGASSELSPAMERLLREALVKIASSVEHKSVQHLVDAITKLADTDRLGTMTRDALLNRLEILHRNPLGSIFSGGRDAIKISDLLDRRVIFDLRHIARTGGMDAARLLYNLVAKRIFDCALQRGIKQGLHHIVVLEEANNLVPEIYTKHTAADVTTGESMVMLQRATGQGVIVISTRPNISSNILANTATKVTFRLPYDSQIGARFMSLDEKQEKYLRTLKRGRALIVMPTTETFEITTEPFSSSTPSEDSDQTLPSMDNTSIEEESDCPSSDTGTDTTKSTKPQTMILDRIAETANHIVAFLASQTMATEIQLQNLIMILITGIDDHDTGEIISDLVSLGTIERESISLVEGGYLFTLPGRGTEAVRTVISEYISQRLIHNDSHQEQSEYPLDLDMIIDNRAILILPELVNSSSIDSTISKIRMKMNELGNFISELIVVVRGSVTAAKLRGSMDKYTEFNAVTIVSAFPSSLETVIERLNKEKPIHQPHSVQSQLIEDNIPPEDEGIIDAVHDVGSATNREIQMRLWFSLIQEFVEISEGQVRWNDLLEFIRTTALQSLRGQTTPMNEEEGRRALTELLADEVLVAVRIGTTSIFTFLESGLWILTPTILKGLKDSTIKAIEKELENQHESVSRNHSYYDICAGDKSFVVFPTQQQLNTLLHLHSEIICRICESNTVICILTASEYYDDSTVAPRNCIIKTLDEGIETVVI